MRSLNASFRYHQQDATRHQPRIISEFSQPWDKQSCPLPCAECHTFSDATYWCTAWSSFRPVGELLLQQISQMSGVPVLPSRQNHLLCSWIRQEIGIFSALGCNVHIACFGLMADWLPREEIPYLPPPPVHATSATPLQGVTPHGKTNPHRGSYTSTAANELAFVAKYLVLEFVRS